MLCSYNTHILATSICRPIFACKDNVTRKMSNTTNGDPVTYLSLSAKGLSEACVDSRLWGLMMS